MTKKQIVRSLGPLPTRLLSLDMSELYHAYVWQNCSSIETNRCFYLLCEFLYSKLRAGAWHWRLGIL